MSGTYGKFYNAQAATVATNNPAASTGTHAGMALNQMLADPLEVSASAVDQLVGYELDNVREELGERKREHERLKREELRNLEQDKRNMKLKL